MGATRPGQLELEYHDLLSLFEFLDNGDGQITLNAPWPECFLHFTGVKNLEIQRFDEGRFLTFGALVQGPKPEATTCFFQAAQS